MPSKTVQKAAHDLLISIAESLDPAPAVFPYLPEGFKQPGDTVVIERPSATSREPFSNQQVLVTLETKFIAISPFKPDVEGEDEGKERVDALRDTLVVAIESLPGNGLLSIGAFSWQHSWSFDSDYYVVGSNLIACEFTLSVVLTRPLDYAFITTPD